MATNRINKRNKQDQVESLRIRALVSSADPGMAADSFQVPKWAGKPAAGMHADVTKDDKLIQVCRLCVKVLLSLMSPETDAGR